MGAGGWNDERLAITPAMAAAGLEAATGVLGSEGTLLAGRGGLATSTLTLGVLCGKGGGGAS